MAIPPHMLTSQDNQPFPPTLFIHMARDSRTSALVDKCVRKLKQSGIKAAAIEAPPLPLDDAFFSARISGLSHATSQRLRHALQRASLLDSEGKLRDDPRRSDWRAAVHGVAGLAEALPGVAPGVADSLQPDESAVAEVANPDPLPGPGPGPGPRPGPDPEQVLNVAWSMHEITADFMRETLAWIESQGGSTAAPVCVDAQVEVVSILF